jgi:hypothetical protein
MKTRLYASVLALAAASLLACKPAEAATGTAAITLTRPTAYTDGTPLAAADIAEYPVVCRFTPTGATSSTACTTSPTALPGGTATGGAVTIANLPAKGGRLCLRIRATANGVNSDPSNETCKDVPAVAPNAPGSVTITITIIVSTDSGS